MNIVTGTFRGRLRLGIVLAGAVTILSASLNTAPANAAPPPSTCEHVNVPVAMAAGQPKDKIIAGTLCQPQSSPNPQTVDVLVPGGTYDSLYWDFPYNSGQYSYVNRTLQAGRATFNMDRIGTGASSKPLSATITFDSDAYTLHQTVQWLKEQQNFSDISVVGHSQGSIVAVQEAGVYQDVNRIVATGFLHSPSINLVLTLGGGLYPAALDSQFAGQGLDPLYLTSIPGKRKDAFYYTSADPNVIAYDDAHKNIVSTTAVSGAVAQLLLPPALNKSSQVTAPVLTMVGDHDILCGTPIINPDCKDAYSVKAHEQPYFTKSRDYSAAIVPNTGHNLPLHPSADQSFSTINQWIQTH